MVIAVVSDMCECTDREADLDQNTERRTSSVGHFKKDPEH
jgi:hypothetical protein